MISKLPPAQKGRHDILREPRRRVTVSLSLATYDLVRRLAERERRPCSRWVALAIEEALNRDLAGLCEPTPDCLPVVSRYLFGIVESDRLIALINCFPDLVNDEDRERLRVLVDSREEVPSIDQALLPRRAQSDTPPDATS